MELDHFNIAVQENVFRGFLSALDEVILPSVSLLPCNCGMAEELWAMVKLLPYERRWVRLEALRERA